MKCDRCGADGAITQMSRFNTDVCCLLCIDDEKLAPNYERARQAEHDAVLNGDYNFPGIGLRPADHEFLARRRAERMQQPSFLSDTE